MTRTILIDADVVLYEVTTACEVATDWGNDMWTLHSDFKEACQRFDCWVKDMMDTLSADKAVLAFSGELNWRKSILPTYKHNRKAKRKPLAFHALKNYAIKTYKTFVFENLEGDDVLGLMAGTPGLGNIKGEKVIVTIDKDLKPIPGLHFNPQKPEEGIVYVDREEADYNHMLQTLTGDAVDGYSGCPGIGPKRASRILAVPTLLWGLVVDAYEKAGLEESDALIQARVARILRWGEYDAAKQEVKLWTP